MHNIFDTHSHYTDSSFDCDRDELLSGLSAKGVRYIMLASTCAEDIKANAQLADKYGYIYTSAGFHPENIEDIPSDYIDIVRNAVLQNPKAKAIGEIGLDYHYDGYDREKQIEVFEKQVILANELDMPVIVHSRDATEDTLNILKKYCPAGVVHCFSGSAETAVEIVKLGMYIGFTGVITFKNSKKAVRSLGAVPLDRLLMETDCPYMSPVPFRGKRCDSSMIAYTAEKASEIKGIPVQELLDITCRNGMELYRIQGD
ncbi:MAG: TatD family hydrolase [Ruminococcus flavefaciens]|nr:TatD family hydrolase [Ruminococcus flavefaciens]